MRTIDQDGREIVAPDLEAGHLVPERILVAHHDSIEAVEEVSHYEVIAEYEGGGKDVQRVVDIPGIAAQDAWDEYEDVYRYVPYTAAERAKMRIEVLKVQLAETDYITAKAVDAMAAADSLTALLAALKSIRTEYATVFAQRAEWRAEINKLEEQGDDA